MAADVGFQKLTLRTLLSLPTPILRALSGGGVVFQGGRTLEPRFQYLANAARGAPPPMALTPELMRAATTEQIALVTGAPEPGVKTESHIIDGPNGQIPMRAYRPSGQDGTAPVLVFAHFGGGVIGDLETADTFCSILARIAHCAVVSVDYRLAPEHRFPAGLDDVAAAYRYVRDHASQFGAPAGHVAIGGDSIGGNFAAVICQDLKRAGEPQPVLQLLIYPAVDLASEAPSMTTYAGAYPLSRATMEWFAAHYLGPDGDPKDPRASPLCAAAVDALAPAIVVTAGFDPLVDQGEAYARRLRDAGVHVVYRCYDGLPHAFTAFTGAAPAADIACREIAGLVREGFEGRIP
ncbi:MAG TPA: alpha/beta hydrolase [Caulobacteraceae bacterium]|jgi:acetyl esterase/lipase|nr:alpha/beta hydrolase [Caulobacteraceae bacterium]